MDAFHLVYKPGDEVVVFRFLPGYLRRKQKILYMIDDEVRDLRRYDGKVIGNDDKDDSCAQPDTIFPQVFIKGLEMSQKKIFMQK